MKYTIISGTDRKNSNTKKAALEYQRLLGDKGIAAKMLALDEVDVLCNKQAFKEAEAEFLIPAEKIIILMPEYNGSYPGVLKVMLDQSDIRKSWWHKKVLLTGISTGRAGNLRGMEHLTGSLLYLKMLVHHNRLPISVIDRLMDADGKFNDAGTLAAVDQQLDEFIAF